MTDLKADTLSIIGVLNREMSDLEETDEAMKGQIFYETHDSILGGHRGMKKAYSAIREHYYWSNMKAEIEEYVRKCTKCQLNKVLRAKKKSPME
jgi:hypothetical protein